MSKKNNKANAQKVGPKKKNKKSKSKIPQEIIVVNAPAAKAAKITTNQQLVRQRKDGCYVENRELIMTLPGSIGYTIQASIPLNPGLSGSFLWAAGIASRYEYYRFTHLHVRCITRCGTSTAGSIMIVPDYDASDSPPGDERVASTFRDSVEDVPWKNILCSLDPRKMSGLTSRKFNRYGPLTPGTDPRTSDAGILHLITVGMADNSPVAKVYLDYGVEFYVPQLAPASSDGLGGVADSGGVTSPTNPFGTSPAMSVNCRGCSLDSSSKLSIDQPGTYELIQTVYNATGLTSIVPPTVVEGAISHLNSNGIINPGATQGIGSFSFDTLVPNTVIQLSTLAATLVASQMKLGKGPAHGYEF